MYLRKCHQANAVNTQYCELRFSNIFRFDHSSVVEEGQPHNDIVPPKKVGHIAGIQLSPREQLQLAVLIAQINWGLRRTSRGHTRHKDFIKKLLQSLEDSHIRTLEFDVSHEIRVRLFALEEVFV